MNGLRHEPPSCVRPRRSCQVGAAEIDATLCRNFPSYECPWVLGGGMMLRCGKISCVAGLLLALVAGGGSAAGQDKPEVPTPKTPSASQSQAASKQNPSAAPGLTAPQDENPKRILGIIPNFETKNDAPAGYEPMSVKEKYVVAWHQSCDFRSHFWDAVHFSR